MQTLDWDSTLYCIAVIEDNLKVYQNTSTDKNSDWERPTVHEENELDFQNPGYP